MQAAAAAKTTKEALKARSLIRGIPELYCPEFGDQTRFGRLRRRPYGSSSLAARVPDRCSGRRGGNAFRVRPGGTSIVKRVEKAYKVTGSTQPNDLQFVPEGLWVLDQLDQPTNKAFLVKPEDGTVIREILTEALHASGITYGNGALWIGSTKGKNAQDPPKTMKVDPRTGKTLKQWNTPGLDSTAA